MSGRARLKKVLAKHLHGISILLFVVGLAAAVIVPGMMSQNNFFDENALLGSSIPVSYTESHAMDAYELGNRLSTQSPSQILQSVEEYGRNWALPVVVYNFSHSSMYLDGVYTKRGKNVVLTVPSPRGSGAEAILILVPLTEQAAHANVGIILSIIKSFQQAHWLAHDMIFLFSWPPEGVHHFAKLNSGEPLTRGLFDGLQPSESIPHHIIPAGIMRACICLQMSSYSFTHDVKVSVEGLGGELPNLDMLHLGATAIQTTGLRPVVSEPSSIPTTAALLMTHALGVVDGLHYPFRSINIHGVTFMNTESDSLTSPAHVDLANRLVRKNMHNIAKALTRYLRGTNHLEERLHANAFIYMMMDAWRFLKFDIFAGLMWVGIIALILNAISIYYSPYLKLYPASLSRAVPLILVPFLFGILLFSTTYILSYTGLFSIPWMIALYLMSWWTLTITFHVHGTTTLVHIFQSYVPTITSPYPPHPQTTHPHTPSHTLTHTQTSISDLLLARACLSAPIILALTKAAVAAPALCLVAPPYVSLLCVLGTPLPLLVYSKINLAFIQNVLLYTLSPEMLFMLFSMAMVGGDPLSLGAFWESAFSGVQLHENYVYIMVTILIFPLRLILLQLMHTYRHKSKDKTT